MSRPYVIRVTADDVGRRVSVRSRIAAAPGQPSTTDTVGRLVDWADGALIIEKRDGSRARVPVADLLASKTIPEAPTRRRGSTLPPDQSVEGP